MPFSDCFMTDEQALRIIETMNYQSKKKRKQISDLPLTEYIHIGSRVVPILIGQLRQSELYHQLIDSMRPLCAYTSIDANDSADRFIDLTFKTAINRIQCFARATEKPSAVDRMLSAEAPITAQHVDYMPSIQQQIHGCELLFDWPFFMSYVETVIDTLKSLAGQHAKITTKNHKGYIYFLLTDRRDQPLVKIGWQSKQDNTRTHSIHSHCPYDLINIGICKVKDGVTSEKRLHRYLEYYRYNREWFRYEGKVIEVINFLVNRGYYDFPEITNNFLEWFCNGCEDETTRLKFYEPENRTIFQSRDRFVFAMLVDFARSLKNDIDALKLHIELGLSLPNLAYNSLRPIQ